MRIEAYTPLHHIELYPILHKRKHPIPDELPEIGCVVHDDNIPVAFCFLRKVEGGYGMIDGLTSNPDCTAEQRHEALDMAILYCVEEAKAQGITQLIAFCLDETTVTRAAYHGFVKQPHTMVTLRIKENG